MTRAFGVVVKYDPSTGEPCGVCQPCMDEARFSADASRFNEYGYQVIGPVKACRKVVAYEKAQARAARRNEGV